MMRRLLATLLLSAFLLTSALPAHAAETTTPSDIPLSEMESRIDELVATYMHEYTPGTAIVVVSNGEIIFSRGYGYAELRGHTLVSPTATVFEYGSISKLFVYISLMQLVEQGLIDLDADIHTYLPEDFSRQLNFERSFTVRQLLNHSAGFGEFFFDGFFDAETVTTTATLREGLLATQPRQIYAPGTASSYSNFGSALLGYVVATVSGRDFTSYERENILIPLGMENTKNQGDWFGNAAFMQTQARGHSPNGSGGFNETAWWYIAPYPAGSLRGTAEDLAQLAIALTPPEGESGPLFDSREMLDLMLSPSFSDPLVMRGTYHGFLRYDGSDLTLGHGGGTEGFNTEFAIVPSERFGVVILSNAAGGALFNERVLDLLIGNSRDAIPPPAGDLPDAGSVAGNYVMLRRHEGNILEPLNFMFGANFSVEAIDENTIAVEAMGMTITYQQVEPYIFRVTSPGAPARMIYELRFIMENGNPVGISMSGPMDATIETFRQSMTALLGGAVMAAVSILFFLIAPLVVFIGFLRKQEKSTSLFHHLSNGLLLSGTLLTLNTLVLFVRIGATAPSIQAAQVVPHVWINYILLALTGIFLAVSLVFFPKDAIRPRRKVLYIATIVFTALFTFVLWNWNFFAMM